MHKNYLISSTVIMATPLAGNDLFNFESSIPVSEKIKDEVNKSAFRVKGAAYVGMSGAPMVILSEDYQNLVNFKTYAVIGIASIFGDNYAEAFNSDSIIKTLELF